MNGLIWMYTLLHSEHWDVSTFRCRWIMQINNDWLLFRAKKKHITQIAFMHRHIAVDKKYSNRLHSWTKRDLDRPGCKLRGLLCGPDWATLTWGAVVWAATVCGELVIPCFPDQIWTRETFKYQKLYFYLFIFYCWFGIFAISTLRWFTVCSIFGEQSGFVFN